MWEGCDRYLSNDWCNEDVFVGACVSGVRGGKCGVEMLRLAGDDDLDCSSWFLSNNNDDSLVVSHSSLLFAAQSTGKETERAFNQPSIAPLAWYNYNTAS